MKYNSYNPYNIKTPVYILQNYETCSVRVYDESSLTLDDKRLDRAESKILMSSELQLFLLECFEKGMSAFHVTTKSNLTFSLNQNDIKQLKSGFINIKSLSDYTFNLLLLKYLQVEDLLYIYDNNVCEVFFVIPFLDKDYKYRLEFLFVTDNTNNFNKFINGSYNVFEILNVVPLNPTNMDIFTIMNIFDFFSLQECGNWLKYDSLFKTYNFNSENDRMEHIKNKFINSINSKWLEIENNKNPNSQEWWKLSKMMDEAYEQKNDTLYKELRTRRLKLDYEDNVINWKLFNQRLNAKTYFEKFNIMYYDFGKVNNDLTFEEYFNLFDFDRSKSTKVKYFCEDKYFTKFFSVDEFLGGEFFIDECSVGVSLVDVFNDIGIESLSFNKKLIK